MGIFREAKKLYRKVDNAVVRATTPSWRKKQKPLDPDFSGRDNVVNLRAEKDRQSYDVVIDDSGIHVGYQDKQGKTRWRKAMDVAGEVTSVDMGSPPSSKNPNRVWSRTYKTSGGTFKGLDAQVKYLNDLGYNVQALDKRPAKAWRSGDVAASDKFVQDAMLRKQMTGDPDYFGPYIDPQQAHNTADREFRSGFFRNYTPINEHRGFIFDKDVVEPHSADKPLRENKGGSWRSAGPKPKSREYYDQARPVTTPASTMAGDILQLTGPKTEAPAAPVEKPVKTNARKRFIEWKKAAGAASKPQPATSTSNPEGKSIDLGNGIRIVEQTNAAGQKTLFTGHDGRVIVAVEDSKGRKNYFYQSFSGTSGKDQGRWYPTGGLAVDKSGEGWLVKGDPVNDKGFGRPDLADLEDHLNSVLPHSDNETDSFLETHGYTYNDIQNSHAKGPNFNVDSFNRTGGKHDKKVLESIVNHWKEGHLNKVWGKRGERLASLQGSSSPAPEPPVEAVSTEKADESKAQLLSQILGQVRTHGDKQWRKRLLLSEKRGDAVKKQKLQEYKQQTQDLAVKTIGQIDEDIKSGVPVRQLTEQQILALGTAPSPDLEKLDETPESDQELVSSLISGKAVGERDVSQQILGTPPAKIGNKVAYNDQPLPFTEQHESGFTKEGDIRIAGYQALADAFQHIDPKIAENFRKTAENLESQKSIGVAIRSATTNKEKAQLKNEKERLQNQILNTEDPYGVHATLNQPVGDGVEPILYPRQGEPRLSDEQKRAWGNESGQGNTALKDIHVPGGVNQTILSRVKDPSALPAERVRQARTLEAQVNPTVADEVNLEEYLSGQKPDLTPEQLAEYENLPRTLEMPQQQETYDPVRDVAHQVAVRMGDIAALNEANTMLASGVTPSRKGMNELGDKVVPYTRKNARQRLFNLENNTEQTRQKIYQSYYDQILANPPEDLANIDPNASQEERSRAVSAIVERILGDQLATHATNYTGNFADDPNGLPNVFRSTVESDAGLRRKFGIPDDITQRPSQDLVRQLATPAGEGVSLLDQIDDMLFPGRREGRTESATERIVSDVRRNFQDEELQQFKDFMGRSSEAASGPGGARISYKLSDDSDDEEIAAILDEAQSLGLDVQYNEPNRSFEFHATGDDFEGKARQIQDFANNQPATFPDDPVYEMLGSQPATRQPAKKTSRAQQVPDEALLPFNIDTLKSEFGLDQDQAEAVNTIYEGMGLDEFVNTMIAPRGSKPTGRGLYQDDTELGSNYDFAVPPADEIAAKALSADKQAKYGAVRDLPAGTEVGLRIDIPAYERTGNYVVSVHEGWTGGASGRAGKVIGYDNLVRIENPVFHSNQKASAAIKGGKPKSTIATVDGNYIPDRELPEDFGDWTPAGFNPKKHSYFYDKKTGKPVVSGDEAISVGNSVFVKNPQYGDKTDFLYQAGMNKGDKARAAVEFRSSPEGEKAVLYALTNPNVSSPVHELAHIARRFTLNEKGGFTKEQIKHAEDWCGVRKGNWTKPAEEKFARGFEKYLRTGKAPTDTLKKVFAQFKNWLTNIYKKLAGSPLDNLDMTPQMKEIFDLIVTRKDRMKAAADQVAEQVQGGTGSVGKSGSRTRSKATKPTGTPMSDSVSVSPSVKLAKDYAAANPDYNGDHTRWEETGKYPEKTWNDFDPNHPASSIAFGNYQAALEDVGRYDHPNYEVYRETPIELAIDSYALNAFHSAKEQGLGTKEAQEASEMVYHLAKINKLLRSRD